jgi:hypothetical protein
LVFPLRYFLLFTIPKTIPKALETIIPRVVPIQTVIMAGYSTVNEIVANWVLFPISAIKKDRVTVQKGLS